MIDLLEFEDDQLSEFYGSRNGWTRNLELFGHNSYGEMIDGYHSLQLADVYPLPGLRLYYRFDPSKKWIFAFN